MPRTKCLVCKAINAIRDNEKHPSEGNTRDMLRCILKAQEALRVAIDNDTVDGNSCTAHGNFVVGIHDIGAAMDEAKGVLKLLASYEERMMPYVKISRN